MNRAERRRRDKSAKTTAPRLAQVRGLLERGRGAEARRLLERVLKATPEDAAAWQVAGILALQDDAAPRAVAALRRAVALEPEDLALRTNLAIALGQAGETAAALETLEAVLGVAPDFAAAQFNKGVLLRDSGAGEAALAAMDAALAAQPDYDKARGARAQLLLSLNRCAEALEAYTALGDDLGRARALQGLGRYREAAEAFAALESSDAETLLEQGRCLQESGDIEGAIGVYRRLLVQDAAAYAAVVKSLTSASKGMLYLQPSRLRARLFDHG